MGGSVGGNKSKSKSETGQDVWGPQGGALERLYGNAGDMMDNNNYGQGMLNSIAENLAPYMEKIMNSATGGMDDQLGGGSFGDTTDVRNQLMNNMRGTQGQSKMGDMYSSIVGGEGNTYIDPMVDAMKSGAMENNAMLHSGTAMDAASVGQGGSSRHAMQNAMTNRATNKDMMDKETMMRGGAYDTDLNMKMDIARMADTNSQLNNDRLFNMMTGSDSNKQYGMGYGSQAQNLGMGSMAPWMQNMNQGWNNMTNYSNIIGGPTVLGSGSQSGSSKGAGGGASMKG